MNSQTLATAIFPILLGYAFAAFGFFGSPPATILSLVVTILFSTLLWGTIIGFARKQFMGDKAPSMLYSYYEFLLLVTQMWVGAYAYFIYNNMVGL